MRKFWKKEAQKVKGSEVAEQQSTEGITIRDFLYLDVERVKSIFAQLEEGLVTGRERTGGTAQEVSAKGGGGIPALLSLTAEGKFIWENEERETKTLHDYMYHHVESKMRGSNRVVTVDASTLSPEALRGGGLDSLLSETSFLLINGKIRLDDYGHLKGILQDFSELTQFIVQCSVSQPSEQLSKAQRKQEKPFGDWFVNGLKKFFDTFYEGRCMITIHPNESVPEVYFTGHIVKTFIRDGLESVIFRYGTSPQSPWNVFAQVAYIPPESEPIQNDVYSPEGTLSQKGQSLDESLRDTFNAFRELEKIATGTCYPAISIIPIAVYR